VVLQIYYERRVVVVVVGQPLLVRVDQKVFIPAAMVALAALVVKLLLAAALGLVVALVVVVVAVLVDILEMAVQEGLEFQT
jgi:hypothetical protein